MKLYRSALGNTYRLNEDGTLSRSVTSLGDTVWQPSSAMTARDIEETSGYFHEITVNDLPEELR